MRNFKEAKSTMEEKASIEKRFGNYESKKDKQFEIDKANDDKFEQIKMKYLKKYDEDQEK